MIDSYPARHIQLFCQLFMLVRKNDFLLIQVEAKSQENIRKSHFANDHFVQTTATPIGNK